MDNSNPFWNNRYSWCLCWRIVFSVRYGLTEFLNVTKTSFIGLSVKGLSLPRRWINFTGRWLIWYAASCSLVDIDTETSVTIHQTTRRNIPEDIQTAIFMLVARRTRNVSSFADQITTWKQFSRTRQDTEPTGGLGFDLLHPRSYVRSGCCQNRMIQPLPEHNPQPSGWSRCSGSGGLQAGVTSHQTAVTSPTHSYYTHVGWRPQHTDWPYGFDSGFRSNGAVSLRLLECSVCLLFACLIISQRVCKAPSFLWLVT
jgi:hypothetical protein